MKRTPRARTCPASSSRIRFLTSGATTIDPRGNVVKAGLYLDGNGPHPINSFGCTICHGGQGSGTDFTFASHSPDSLEQAEEWKKEHGWQNFHFWDFPMLPDRFIESGCLKCHTQITDIPQATKLQAGYQRITKYGCTGCHTIGGEGSIGPDLSDERQVGPNLSHIAAKDAKEWVVKWIANPHAFRPDSRMPRFYGLSNNGAKEDWPKNYAEIYAITHYLYAKSTPPADFTDPPAKTDPAKGKELFLQKGCLACHQHRPYAEADIQLSDKRSINPAYKPDPARDVRPPELPGDGPRECPGRFRPQSLEHRRQVRGQAGGPEVAVELDPGARAIPPQEPDAQPSAHAARRGRHRELAPVGAGRMARHDGRARPGQQGSEGRRRRAGEALRLQERQLQDGRRQVGRQVALARSTSSSPRSSRPKTSCCTWARRRSRGWAASAATPSPASRTPSRSAPPSTTGESRTPPGSITAISPNT